jgi:hypothetical protein
MQLSMSVNDGQGPERGITRMLHCLSHKAVVKFRTPLPTWAAANYPEDAEFKLGYVRAMTEYLLIKLNIDI